MMKFRTVKSQIISILSAAEAGRYVTVGSQKQSKGADENLELPRVVVYYASGNFPLSSNSYQAVKDHRATYEILFTVVAQSKVDLSVLNGEGATAPQMAAALAARQDASDLADNDMDKVFDDVFQVLMDASNYDLGLTEGEVTDRNIDNFIKDDPVPRGEYVILTGRCSLTCKMEEVVSGDIGTPAVNSDTTIDIDGDQGDNMGVDKTLPV